jgi:hypothetical protein
MEQTTRQMICLKRVDVTNEDHNDRRHWRNENDSTNVSEGGPSNKVMRSPIYIAMSFF